MKRTIIYPLIVFLGIFVSFLIYFVAQDNYDYLSSAYKNLVDVIPLILTLFTVYLFTNIVLNYLDKEKYITHKISDIEDEQLKKHIKLEINDVVQNSFIQQQEVAMNFSSEDKAQVLANIQAKLETDAMQSYVDELLKIATYRAKEDGLEHSFVQIVDRLRSEIYASVKRGNINLSLGVGISVAGMMYLGYSVILFPTGDCGGDSSEKCTEILLTYFLPRFSLVILIEIFAYFFLRLYKQSLDEIKYYQNEITNIEAKQLALQLAMRHEDQPLRTKVAEELAKTERNFILQKDQSTVEIEREKLASNNHANLINALKDIVNIKKSS